MWRSSVTLPATVGHGKSGEMLNFWRYRKNFAYIHRWCYIVIIGKPIVWSWELSHFFYCGWWQYPHQRYPGSDVKAGGISMKRITMKRNKSMDKTSYFLTVSKHVQVRFSMYPILSDKVLFLRNIQGLSAFSALNWLDPQQIGFVSTWGTSKFDGLSQALESQLQCSDTPKSCCWL